MVWVKPPKIASVFFKDVIWNFAGETEKNIYLTFDDGPTPEITMWVLDILEKFNAKATFFCVGNNIIKHPEIFSKIIEQKHSVGNHTYNHIKGWSSKNSVYFNDIEKFEQLHNTRLFRPPYGKIKPSQISYLKTRYKIIMWDILSGDYNRKTSPEQCINNVIDNIHTGAIIVFHDSKKSAKTLTEILPPILEYARTHHYNFKPIL